MVENILLSGANGFVGTNLIQYTKRNCPERYSFFSLLRTKNTEDLNSLSWSELGKIDSLNLSTFIHLAGKAHDTGRDVVKDDYFEINTNLSIFLFRAFLRSKASQFIFLSSVKAVVDEVDGILREDAETNPSTVYGQSKLMAEQEMQKELNIWLISNPRNNKKLIILRPCMIHGPGNKGNLNLLYALVSKNMFWPLASFDNQRSFLSIDNLCFAIHEFLRRDLPAGIYNVADDQPISTNELIKLISLATKKRIFFLRIPKYIVTAIAELGDVLNLPLNTTRIQKLTGNYIVSNQKLCLVLGAPLPLKCDEGLLITISSFIK